MTSTARAYGAGSAGASEDLGLRVLTLQTVNRKLKKLDARIEGSITDGTLDRTIDGASTLTLAVHDPRRVLLRSGVFSQQIDVRLDDYFWRLVKVTKSGDDLSLVFEDRAVALLRGPRRPKKASRENVTRAQFALSLIREVRPPIPYRIPELTQRQPIAASTESRMVAERLTASSQKPPTVKGKVADAEQTRNAARVLAIASANGASTKVAVSLASACIVESLLRNPPGGDRDSRGILQIRDRTARAMRINNRSIDDSVRAFLLRGFTGRGGAIALAASNPSWSAGQIAQAVQGSAHPRRYDQYAAEAQRLVGGSARGEAGVADRRELRRALPFQFRRGTTDGKWETSWDALGRLAEEVNWRRFVANGTCWFVSEDWLRRQPPLFDLTEDTLGVDAIDFDIDNGKANSQATVYARIGRWRAPPGSVVRISKCGPGNGIWLVASVSRGIFDAAATITLKRPTQRLPEPAPEMETITTGGTGARALGTGKLATGGEKGAPSAADAVYSAALSMDQRRWPYAYGGGHGRAGVASRGREGATGFDCSSSTSAILAAGRLGFRPGGPTMVSGDFAARWGAPGRGQFISIYANRVHVFVVFHTTQGDQHFGTGRWGKAWNGPGFNPQMHPFGGFTVKHWPGM